MSEAVDKLIEANQKASEQHRIAYGKAMYNQAISDAIDVATGIILEIKANPPSQQSFQSIALIEAIIYVLVSFKKAIPIP